MAPTTEIERLIAERSTIDPESGCWIWFWSAMSTGYGDFRLNKRHHLAHRASYEVYKGPIPEGMHVLHRCDVKSCVNPDHLFLGTNLDNIQDSVRKGRRKGVTRNRPSGLKYKSIEHACARCGKSFRGNRKAKHCSGRCYHRDRRNVSLDKERV